MVKSYWERRQDAKAALLAAREAIDALEQRLDRYWEAVSADTGRQMYLRLELERHIGSLKAEALAEAGEAVSHLQDAVAAWWDGEHVGPDRTDAA